MLWLELSVTDSLMRDRFFRQALHHSQQTFRIYPAAHQLSMVYNHRGHPCLTVEPLTGHISFPSSRYVFPEMPAGVSGWCDVCAVCLLAVTVFQYMTQLTAHDFGASYKAQQQEQPNTFGSHLPLSLETILQCFDFKALRTLASFLLKTLVSPRPAVDQWEGCWSLDITLKYFQADEGFTRKIIPSLTYGWGAFSWWGFNLPFKPPLDQCQSPNYSRKKCLAV